MEVPMRLLNYVFLVGMLATFYITLSSNKDLGTMNNNNVEKPVVLMKTSMGDIKIELYPDKAPITVQNFLQYVKNGQYDHTIFHRVIDNFMIQGGGFTANMSQKSTQSPIKNEASNGLKNMRGTKAMARTQEVNSATAQFFINVKDNSFLDFKSENPHEYGYCVFGKVIEGMDTVDKIKAVDTTAQGPYRDIPVKAVEIVSITQM
jgi:cyclophilin family peptidyl-prolyl cis-trans isomerase